MNRPSQISWSVPLAAMATAAATAAGLDWRGLSRKPDDWFRGADGVRATANVLSHQAPLGDWPKNLDTSATLFEGDRAGLRGTFDNGATVGEVRFLARAFRVAGDSKARTAVEKALDHILAAQYPNGGWPQTFPPGKDYPRFITFNDNTTVNLLELARDVARSDEFASLDAQRREKASRAFDAGIACILRCQVHVDGKPTVWCAQHDEATLGPRGARTFELASLSGSESAGILLLLMSLDDPSPEVLKAVEGGVDWFDKVKIAGIRQVTTYGDRSIVADPSAPPLWARFYEIDTNRPFFCGRDGVKKYAMSEIEAERRNGYAWYGNWGIRVAERYAAWKKAKGR